MRDRRIPALIVAVASFALYAAALRNGFAYDDVPAILGDPRVMGADDSGDPLWAAVFLRPYWSAQGAELGIYRPLVTLGFVLDYAVSGGSALWFHAVNLAWNALACVLVFLLLSRFFERGAALAGGLLFSVHPVHTEAVANIVGRAELVAAAFGLAAGLIWSRPGGRWRVPATLALLAAALLSKESAVMLPALLVLLDFAAGHWRATRAEVRGYVVRNLAAFGGMAGVIAIWAALRHVALGGIAPTTLHAAAEVARGPLDLFRTALAAWPEYLRLLIFPVTLLADYGPRVIMPGLSWTPEAVLGLTILIGLVGGGLIAVMQERRRTALAFWWLPLAILPASNLVVPIGALVAERTLYLPSFALAVVGAGLWQHGSARPAAVRAALALVVALFAARTHVRVPEWHSTETIFAALDRDRPDAYRARWYRARVARAGAGAAAARPLFREAIHLWPYRKALVLEAARNAVEAGGLREARALALHATRTWPDDLSAQRLLAATSLDVGDTATAARAAAAGLALDPSDDLLRSIRSTLRPDTVE